MNGLHYSQEYLCLPKENLEKPLQVYQIENGQVVRDITEKHAFVGYKPLIFAFSPSTVDLPGTLNLYFSENPLSENEKCSPKDAIATLLMKKLDLTGTPDSPVFFYEGKEGWHRFVSGFSQVMTGLYNRLYNKKEGNVFLDNKLYRQVQIAYSIPRKISLIILAVQGKYNVFPTDLHGRADKNYIISLRKNGLAAAQVCLSEKLLLCDMDISQYRSVYALGKNHMQPVKEASDFIFSDDFSKNFNLPLPNHVRSYKELLLENSFQHGIHNLLLFRIVGETFLKPETATLAHIHNSYATWRYKHQISSNLMLR